MKSNYWRMLEAVFRSFSLAAYPAFSITGYPAGYPVAISGIRPDTGYKKRPDYPASWISSASLLFTVLYSGEKNLSL